VLSVAVISVVEAIPESFNVQDLPEMEIPTAMLLCPPKYFDVIDVKNPFMRDQIGKVNQPEAERQWQDLRGRY
jgi:hypothetical protein